MTDRPPQGGESSDEPVLRVRIEASSLEDLKAFTDEIHADLGCRPVPRVSDGRYVIDAYLPEAEARAVRSSRGAGRVSMRTIENATEVGRLRQQEVGQGDQFAERSSIPRGLGRKE